MTAAGPWPSTPPVPWQRAAYADAVRAPFWLERLERDAGHAPLSGDDSADLVIVGAGFTGLWAALLAKAEDPSREVVVLEARAVAHGASGRNGGFAIASLTHGLENGLARFADEIDALEQLGAENFAGLLADLDSHRIKCDLELGGELTVALEAHQEAWLAESFDLHRERGYDVELLDGEAMRAEVHSPLFRGGLWNRTGAALLDPAKLALGLARAASGLGVRIHERTEALALDRSRDAVAVRCAGGTIRAPRVLLATSAYRPLLRQVRRYVLPVYDYVLVTEPLGPGRLEQIGWRRRQGLSDSANQFHYYRLTGDGRILWGGYDAVYRYGGPVEDRLDDDERSFAGLSQRFFATFPQLEGVRFSHRWGGAIDTCSRFSVFFGTAHSGRVAFALGYTGLGVAASRFGARVGLDLLDGRESEASRLRYVRRRPLPFPPEPLRSAVVQLTRNRLAAADRRAGRRGLWLRTLDRFGLGFDS